MDSKIGVQSQNGVIQDASKLLAKHLAAWKLLGQALSLDFAKRIRAESPSTLIILRAADDNWSLDAGVVDYASRAMKAAQPFLSAGVCDFLEPPNEPVVQNDVNARRLNDQMVQIAGIYKANGFKPLAYQFSVGNPSYELWQYLNDGVIACDGWLGLHQYGAPTLQANAADLSLRHRKVLPLLSPAARGMCKIIITECGIDLGIGRNPPDGLPTGGGYRNLPQQGDNESYWIQNLLTQLAWWDSELAKDKEVIATTLFGYAMLHPWETFDVAAVDTDRSAFINWMGSGAMPPPIGDGMSTAQGRLNRAWNSLNIPYNPDAAFPKIAKQLGLGKPEGMEWTNVNGFSGQGFNLAFLESPAGDVLSAKAYDWLTGEVYVPSVTPPPSGGVIPFAIPPALISIGASATEGTPVTGLPFFRLTGAAVRSGVSAFCKVTVIGKNGLPAVDVQVLNIFPDGNGEILLTDGSGVVSFNYGASSAFTPPAKGPFTVFIADGATKDDTSVPKHVSWKDKLGDTIISLGDPNGIHTECYVQFVQM